MRILIPELRTGATAPVRFCTKGPERRHEHALLVPASHWCLAISDIAETKPSKFLALRDGDVHNIALPMINAGRWCDAHNIQLEKLYGTDLHDRGANLIDMKIHPIPAADMQCLKPGELGSPEFTIEGWLKTIEAGK